MLSHIVISEVPWIVFMFGIAGIVYDWAARSHENAPHLLTIDDAREANTW